MRERQQQIARDDIAEAIAVGEEGPNSGWLVDEKGNKEHKVTAVCLAITRLRGSADRCKRAAGQSIFSGRKTDGLNVAAGGEEGGTVDQAMPFATLVTKGSIIALAVCVVTRVTPRSGAPSFSTPASVALAASSTIVGRVINLVHQVQTQWDATQGGAVAALPDQWTWDHSSVGTISVAGNLVQMLDPP